MIKEADIAVVTVEQETMACFHCGETIESGALQQFAAKDFCCTGCVQVFRLLSEGGLEDYYRLAAEAPGLRPNESENGKFAFVDDEQLQAQLADFHDEQGIRLRLNIPSIHCVSCVWLLEKLPQLLPGVKAARVNFSRRELSLQFDPQVVKLSQICATLADFAYEPQFSLGDAANDQSRSEINKRDSRRRLARLTLAFFCMGNIMLMSFPAYFGLDISNSIGRLFSWINLAFTLPLVFFCSAEFMSSIPVFLKTRKVSLDLPVAVGILALFLRTVWAVCLGSGEGYADSLAGFIFFLLLGRTFQRVSYDKLSFERDFTDFFPLSCTRLNSDGQREAVPVKNIVSGDVIVLRSGELLPVDGEVEQGEAHLDYSFVTGESEVKLNIAGEQVFAGARQVNGLCRVRATGAVDQAYLTSLWQDEAFAKSEAQSETNLSLKAGRIFTMAVPVLAISAAAWHGTMHGAVAALDVFVAVLIVACPCALALSMPLVQGFSLRFLARVGFYLREGSSLEILARKDSQWVFDKTGTLSESGAESVNWQGVEISSEEMELLRNALATTVHPKAQALLQYLKESANGQSPQKVEEVSGSGMQVTIADQKIRFGSASWCGREDLSSQSGIHLCINEQYRGHFSFTSRWRQGLKQLFAKLRYKQCIVLSGDGERDKSSLSEVTSAQKLQLNFMQSPQDKLERVRSLRSEGSLAIMVGDGLNDAGALREADCGIAVVEQENAFTPACDAILRGDSLTQLPDFQRFARFSQQLIKFCFVISIAYNIIGLGFAISGRLTPLVSAILMPVSSFTILLLALVGSLINHYFLAKTKDNI